MNDTKIYVAMDVHKDSVMVAAMLQLAARATNAQNTCDLVALGVNSKKEVICV